MYSRVLTTLFLLACLCTSQNFDWGGEFIWDNSNTVAEIDSEIFEKGSSLNSLFKLEPVLLFMSGTITPVKSPFVTIVPNRTHSSIGSDLYTRSLLSQRANAPPRFS